MRIAPRLARPAAAAALAAAALALPATSASAMTMDECINARVETANRFFQNAFAPGISQADYWFWMNRGIYALGYTGFCGEGR